MYIYNRKLFKEITTIPKYDWYFTLEKMSISFLMGIDYWYNINSEKRFDKKVFNLYLILDSVLICKQR